MAVMPFEPQYADGAAGCLFPPTESDQSNPMKKILLNTAILGGCVFSAAAFAADPPATPAAPTASTYSAGEVRGQLAVELTIGKGCEVVNGTSTGVNAFGTLNFGEVSSLTNSMIDGKVGGAGAVVKLNCTKDVAYRISLDDGRNASSGTRRLALEGGTQAAFVPYNLYQDAARSKVWDSKNPYTGSGSGNADDMVVYGRIPTMATTPASGKYADVVMMTVSW